MKLPNILKPKNNYQLMRLGKNNDGGYLVGKKSVTNSKNLISFGIADDWTFEDHFQKINKDIKVFAFDDTLDFKWLLKNCIKNIKKLLFFEIQLKDFTNSILLLLKYKKFLRKINFKKKFIDYDDVLSISSNKSNIFFKIDIEGSEYRIFDELISIKDKIEAIVIELHDIDLHKDKIINFIKKINLCVTHIHPNNYSRLDKFLNPTCIELTLEKNFDKINSSDVILPNPLDQKCDPKSKDHNLSFEID